MDVCIMFRINILGTGSDGNCAIISDGETDIMIDAGLKIGLDYATKVAAVLITHDHISDHCRYAKALASVYARPIYATKGTMGKLDIPMWAQNVVRYNEPFDIGTLRIIPFPTSHDAAEPCGYFIGNRRKETIAWISDTGTLDSVELDADCYCIEANYDEETLEGRLESGAVYAGLHARLTSDFGHLSIQQTGEWLSHNARNDATIIILHRSKNNAPRISSLDGFENVHWPDERGRVTVEFGIRDKCPF